MNRVSLPKIWIFFFVIVMILVIAALLQPRQSVKTGQLNKPGEQQVVLPPTREENARRMLQNSQNAVYVSEQSAGQSTIDVGYVVFSKSGFVVVYEDDHGLPGKIVATSSLLKGRSEHVLMNIPSPLQSNGVYYAELYEDDGNGVFDAKKDKPVQDDKQSVVLMSFLAK